jgi:hypothetical protein
MRRMEKEIGTPPEIRDMTAWDGLGAGGFNQTRGAFGELFYKRVLSDRSTAHQWTRVPDHRAYREQTA